MTVFTNVAKELEFLLTPVGFSILRGCLFLKIAQLKVVWTRIVAYIA